MSRLFIAIELSDEMKKTVAASLHEMKKQGIKGSYVPIANMHLTLAFIGETKETETIKKALEAVKIRPFKLTLSDPGVFGDLLYVGVKGNQGLTSAAKGVREALDAAKIPYDRKKFEPHITLIRKVGGDWKNAACPKGEMMVKQISLMKSEQKDGKRVYTRIAEI